MRRPSPIRARRLAGGTTALAVLLALAGCGDADDHRFGTFTDCASVGAVTRTTDPAGDQRAAKGTRAAAGADEPRGDLVAVGLARGGGDLCVEFQARARIEPAAAYVVTLRPQDAETPAVGLEATVLAGVEPEALLDAGGRGDAFRKVDARVGIRGDRLSIVVARDVFAAHGVAAVFDRFRFEARAAATTADRGSLTDCAPSCT
jgi:hypothetical protein